jgi:hypothetical protein
MIPGSRQAARPGMTDESDQFDPPSANISILAARFARGFQDRFAL